MKLKRFILLLALLSPLLIGCGDDKDPGNELPPPVIGGDDTDPQGNEDEGGGAGKEVTPLGKDWTAKTIDEGINYYTFNGVDEITQKHQEAFVIDVDLNNPAYQVKYVYENPRIVTSEAFKKHKPIAAINANYEQGSIYFRLDGKEIYGLKNTTISDTGIPNWKSEAAFAITGDRSVKFLWAGSQKKGEVTVPQQRAYYTGLSVTDYPSFMSSAPMLIDNYNKVGENFADYTKSLPSSLSGEDPDKHQRTLHPRTAVALTEKNHLILFVVDGRIQSAGMSARQLTRFLAKWFNPQYALNLDGGGSTTMCVQGEGDPNTHVVNYPCSENKNYDHTGERARDVFVMVFKK